MRRLLFLALLLTSLLPSSIVLARSDESDKSVITQELATSCDTSTYKCLCDSKPTDIALTAPLDTNVCANGCATSFSTSTTYSITCTNKATPSTTITHVSGSVTPVTVTTEEKKDPIIPNLIVDIGAVFSPPTQDGAYTQTTFLAVYVNAIYKLLMISCSILAVTMIMVAGLQYTLARGNPKAITKAKDRIKNAVIGLVLLMSAYTMAYLIDPNTTLFGTLNIQSVDKVEIIEPDENFDEPGSGTPYVGGVSQISGAHLSNHAGDDGVGTDILTALNTAATAYFNSSTYNIKVTSASRTVLSQAKMFVKNCLLKNGVCSPGTCDPTGHNDVLVNKSSSGKFTLVGSLTGTNVTTSNADSIAATLAAIGKTNNCAHTSNVAVDIWPNDSISRSFCANVAHMDALVKSMTDPSLGSSVFCRLDSEAWHFELDRVKRDVSSCKTTYTNSQTSKDKPDSTCNIWDYLNHCCFKATDANNPPSKMCPSTSCK